MAIDDDDGSAGPQADVARLSRVAACVGVAVFALTCIFTLIFYSRGRHLRDHYDDSYITYRFAAQLARGNGLVFNPGDRIDAASSFLYAIALATAYRVGIQDLEGVALFVGVASAGGVAVVVFWTSHHLTTRLWLSGAMGLLAGVHGLISGWANSGMETALYAFLVALAVGVGFFRVGPRWLLGLALCLALLTRVEGILLWGAWAVEEALQLRRRGLSTDPAENRRVISVAFCAALTLAAFFAFKRVYYGTFLPHPYHLKRLLRANAPDPMHLAVTWLKTAAAPVVLAIVGSVALIRRRQPGAVGAVTFVVLTFAACALGPRAGWGRYSVQALPVVMMLAGCGVDALFARVAAVGVSALAAVAAQTAVSCVLMLAYLQTFAADQTCRKQVGEYMNAHLVPAETILSADIGAIGYVALDFSFLDPVGLTSLAVLNEYRAGRNLDRVFEKGLPKFAADTWVPGSRGSSRGTYKGTDKVARPATLLLNVQRGSSFAKSLQDEGVLYKCQAGKEWFAVGPIGEARPPSSP